MRPFRNPITNLNILFFKKKLYERESFFLKNANPDFRNNATK